METRQNRRKESFWGMAVVVLMVVCVMIAAGVYTTVEYAGILDPESIHPVHDARWGNQYSTPGFPITSIIKRDNRLFVGTDGNGLQLFDEVTQQWASYRQGYGSKRMPENRISLIKTEGKNRSEIWTLTRNGGLALSRDGDAWRTLFGATPFAGLNDMPLVSAGRNGSVVAAGTRGHGLGIYDLSMNDWISQYTHDTIPALPSNEVRVVRADMKTAGFWVGTAGGLAYLNQGSVDGVWLADSLARDVVDVEVEENGIWYLTGGHISIGRVDPAHALSVMIQANAMPAPPEDLTAVTQHDEVLWAGTQYDGLLRYHLPTHQWRKIDIATSDTTMLQDIRALTYNARTDELFAGSDDGLRIIPQPHRSDIREEDISVHKTFRGVRKIVNDGAHTYFLTDAGKLGVRRPEQQEDRSEWWRFLRKRDQEDPEFSTLVDVSVSGFNTEDISAVCQSEDRLYIGTIHGEIAWYDKLSHAWSALAVPLSHAVEQMVHNPYTGTTVALSGHALYRSPPGSDIFILYLSIPGDRIEIAPTQTGYLFYTNETTLAHTNDATNRITYLITAEPAAEPNFQPVTIEPVGASLYIVTKTGRVLIYDTLRRRWDIPDDIFDSGVTHLKGVDHRVVYQTEEKGLYGSGGNTLIGGGSLGLTDSQIRHAAEQQQMLWVAGDFVIGKYNMSTHTWMDRDRITIEGDALSHLLPLGRRLAYRTGPAGRATGQLWFEGRRIDAGVGHIVQASNALWYVKNGNINRWSVGMDASDRMLGGGLSKLPDETLISAADLGRHIWLATNRRLLAYHKTGRSWSQAPLPGDERIRALYPSGDMLYATTADALYRMPVNTGRWSRISPRGAPLIDSAVSPSGAVMLYGAGALETAPNRRSATPVARRLSPRDAARPIDWRSILAVRQTASSLYMAASNYLHRYDLATHAWDDPLMIAQNGVSRAVIQDNRLWASTVDGRILTTVLTDQRRPDIEERRPPQPVQDLLVRTDDIVWVDTPFWRWARRQGRIEAVVKTAGRAEISLAPMAGAALTMFPFDRFRSVAHDGADIWLATDAGVIRFPEATPADINTWRVYPTDTPARDITTTGHPAEDRQVIYRTASETAVYYRFDEGQGSFIPFSITASDLDPFEDRVLIDTPLWRWTLKSGTIQAVFNRIDMADINVFETHTPEWRFRFDNAQSMAVRNSEMYVFHDGLISQYNLADTAFTLTGMMLTPGPSLSPGELVETVNRDAVYIRVGRSSGNERIFQSAGSGSDMRLERAGGDAADVFRTEILIDNGFWRWERDNLSGRVTKYFLSPDGQADEFYLTGGRFAFDDIQSFTVDRAYIWLATSGGVARYPASSTRLPLGALRYERRIADHQDPMVSLIHARNDTLFCEVRGRGTYVRPVDGDAWQPGSPNGNYWLHQPVVSPFWTWTHDVKNKTVSGVYRDAHGAAKPVTWPSGVFIFDRISNVTWDGDTFWLDTEAGLSAYRDHGPILTLDSLQVYTEISNTDRLFTIPEGMPAAAGVYAVQRDRLYRFDPDNDRWAPDNQPESTDRSGYATSQYLRDRIRYDMLADYDGFWRCRRRASDENPEWTPRVVLETRVMGAWQPITLHNGRFDFDDVRDFTLEGSAYLWLATRAGICRYDLRQSRLDLRTMKPFWGPRYEDATDVARSTANGADRLTVRRGRNNNTLIDIDLRDVGAQPLAPYESPFTDRPQVETPYWRWVRQEQFRGSVATGYKIMIEMRDATGAWTPMIFDTGDGPMPFDTVTSIAGYNNALWMTTPVGVFQYPTDRPLSISEATFYNANGNLQDASRILVMGTDDRQTSTLFCEAGAGPNKRLFYYDPRGNWQESVGRNTLDIPLFQEGDWHWYEQNGEVRIYFQDDRTRPRSVYGAYFADRYIRSVSVDSASIWLVTPAGFFRYANVTDDAPMRLLDWIEWADVNGLPAKRMENIRSSYAGMMDDGLFWLLTRQGVILLRIRENRLDFDRFLAFDSIAGEVVEGQLMRGASGEIVASLRFAGDSRPGPALYRIWLQSDTAILESYQTRMDPVLIDAVIRARSEFPDLRLDDIVAVDEDDRHVWIATTGRVYRVYKDLIGME